jgi:hypothetical protein
LSGAFGSGEGLSIDVTGLASAKETSSWIGLGSIQRGSNGVVLSRMRSRRASPSAMVLWVNDPPADISSYTTDFLLRPNQKCCNSTWFGIEKFGLDLDSIEKRFHAAPMFSIFLLEVEYLLS